MHSQGDFMVEKCNDGNASMCLERAFKASLYNEKSVMSVCHYETMQYLMCLTY